MVEKSKRVEGPANQAPSDVMQLKETNRISIPSVVLRAVGWPKGEPLKLIAELMEAGRVRLHRREEIEQELGELRERLAAEENEESLEKLAVLGDRYRELSLEKEGRVRLTEAVLLHLDVTPGTYPYLLLRAFGNNVEILSHDDRAKRNQRYRADTTP